MSSWGPICFLLTMIPVTLLALKSVKTKVTPVGTRIVTRLASSSDGLSSQVDTLGLNKIGYHIFLCADQTKPKCCSKEDSLVSWDFLKARLKELKLIGSKPNISIARSKVNCLQVCAMGPICVVYPEGVWYHSCTPAVLEEIIQSHILKGVIVDKYCFNKNGLAKFDVIERG